MQVFGFCLETLKGLASSEPCLALKLFLQGAQVQLRSPRPEQNEKWKMEKRETEAPNSKPGIETEARNRNPKPKTPCPKLETRKARTGSPTGRTERRFNLNNLFMLRVGSTLWWSYVDAKIANSTLKSRPNLLFSGELLRRGKDILGTGFIFVY